MIEVGEIDTGGNDQETVTPAATTAEEPDEVGEDAAAQVQEIERIFEEKRERLQKLEKDAAELRANLNVKDAQIAQLKEELGLTRIAVLKKSVEQSTPFRKTKELGDRVVQSETYKKVGDAFSSAGQRTSEAFGKAGTSLKENETLQSVGSRLRSASISVKEKVSGAFTRTQSYSESPQNESAEESASYANTT